MLKASDDEIREFFDTTIFEGVFSKEIKNKTRIKNIYLLPFIHLA